MNLLQRAAIGLQTLRESHAAVTIEYTRDDGSAEISVELTASVGEPPAAVMDASGLVTEYTSRDYLIRASLLVLGGQQVLPQSGDRIVETIGSVESEFVVTSQGGEKPWRWSDPARTTLRVHTKQVS